MVSFQCKPSIYMMRVHNYVLRVFVATLKFPYIKLGCLWQRLYSVVDVNVETQCMRLLYFVNPFYTRSSF